MSIDQHYSKPILDTPCVEGCQRGDNGYAIISLGGKHYAGHRLVWMLAYGSIPQGMLVRHKCDNHLCVNPLHLELGSHEDNMRDSAERGTHRHGEDHANAKLTENKVREIREKYAAGGVSYTALAHEYGLCVATVSQVCRRVTWRHV